MYKHRENTAFPPTTIDPGGSGSPAYPTSTGNMPNSSVSAGARKRGRDIRGLDRFREVIFGEKGFPHLHAMATRSTALMHPPEGIPEARQRYRVAQEAEGQEGQGMNATHLGAEGCLVDAQAPRVRRLGADDEDLWAMFDERKRAEKQVETHEQHHEQQQRERAEEEDRLDESEGSWWAAARAGVHASGACHSPSVDRELATYHHKQLDALLRIVYEFNHTTLVNLPMQDTLALSARCGKEAVAHVLEYEVQLRMKREAKLRELRDLKEMKEALQRRADTAREASEERELAEAEVMQALLDNQEQEEQWGDSGDRGKSSHLLVLPDSAGGDETSHNYTTPTGEGAQVVDTVSLRSSEEPLDAECVRQGM